jgi:hypothetical protein
MSAAERTQQTRSCGTHAEYLQPSRQATRFTATRSPICACTAFLDIGATGKSKVCGSTGFGARPRISSTPGRFLFITGDVVPPPVSFMPRTARFPEKPFRIGTGRERRPVVQSEPATGFLRTPIPSISISTISPGLRKIGGLRTNPTPLGVPVEITSPGSSVMV